MYRDVFLQGLNTLARANARLSSPWPILVGGAAVEIETQGQAMSDDFDVVCWTEEAYDLALKAEGFSPYGRRYAYLHQSLPFALEMVSGGYYDGRADLDRTRLYHLPDGVLRVAAVEDLIVDRLCQWQSNPQGMKSRYYQAQVLWQCADGLDLLYLSQRLQQETGQAWDLGANASTPGPRVLDFFERQRFLAQQPQPFSPKMLQNPGALRTPIKRALLRKIRQRLKR